MSARTILYEDSGTRVEEVKKQSPLRPWTNRTARFKLVTALAALLPLLFIATLYMLTEIPGAIIVVVIYLPIQLVAAVVAALLVGGRNSAADAVIIVLSIGATLLSVIIVISILWSIIIRGLEAMSLAFLTQNNTYISPPTPLGYGGIAHALLGTVMIVLLALIVSVPIGIATAIYITEVKGRFRNYVRFFVQAESGVPSVVAGLFILSVLIFTGILSQSALAGALAYSILMLPTVARTSEEVLKLIPDDLRTGALALGSTRAKTVLKVVLPAARTGIITATILGIARVMGETAPLLLTALTNDKTVWNPVAEPIASLPTFIFFNVALPFPSAVARAWGAALVLMALVAIVFTAARFFGAKKFATH
jgi:phosphate transport system permease protein